MVRRTLLAALVLVLASAPIAAHAQGGGFYGTVNDSEWGISNYNGNSTEFKSPTPALSGGFFANFDSRSRLKAGLDLRGMYGFGYKGGGAGLLALRVSFVPHVNRFQPFFEIGGGIVSVTYDEGYFVSGAPPATSYYARRSTTGDLMLDIGGDLRLTENLDWRIFEWGAAANGENNGANVGFFGTGFVYHVSDGHRRR